MNKNKLLVNWSHIFTGTLFAAALRFIAEFIMARIVTTEVFGYYTLVYNFISMLQEAMSGGIRNLGQRYLAVYNANGEKTKFIKHLMMLSASLVVMFSFGCLIVTILLQNFFDQTIFFEVWSADSTLIIIGALSTAYLYLISDTFRSLSAMRMFIFYKEVLLGIILCLFISAAFFLQAPEARSLILVYSISVFLASAIAGFHLFIKIKNLKFRVANQNSKTQPLGSIWRSWFLSQLMTFMFIFRERLTIFIVADVLSASHAGVYFLMLRLLMPLQFFKSSTASLLTPQVAVKFASGENKSLIKDCILANKTQFIFCFPIAIILCCLGSHFIRIFFGAEYAPESLHVSLMIIFYISTMSLGPLGVANRMAGRPEVDAFFFGLTGLLVFLTNVTFVPKFGMLAAVIGTFGSLFLIDILRCIFVHRYLNIRFIDKSFISKCYTLIALTLMIALLDNDFFNFGYLGVMAIYATLFWSELREFSSSIINRLFPSG